MKILPPQSTAELMERSQAIAGLTIAELARFLEEKAPLSLERAKGWVGQLIEKALGATAVNLDQPDFVYLGIELKTIPIAAQGSPSESTFICTAPIPCIDREWEQSRVWRKMAKMLLVPIEAHTSKPLSEQVIGTPILWSPTGEIKQGLRQDWEELTDLMILGRFDELSAHKGKYLQIRPKAPNAKTFIRVIDHQGQELSIVPKGFYLRSAVTRLIIEQAYCVYPA